MAEQEPVLTRLAALIEERKGTSSERSYTATLLAGGPEKIRKKIVEEAAEVFEAAVAEGSAGQQQLMREVADLFYHTLVLLAARQVKFADVERELAQREGVSGLEEKQARQS